MAAGQLRFINDTVVHKPLSIQNIRDTMGKAFRTARQYPQTINFLPYGKTFPQHGDAKKVTAAPSQEWHGRFNPQLFLGIAQAIRSSSFVAGSGHIRAGFNADRN